MKLAIMLFYAVMCCNCAIQSYVSIYDDTLVLNLNPIRVNFKHTKRQQLLVIIRHLYNVVHI